jgi:hypothetical protein
MFISLDSWPNEPTMYSLFKEDDVLSLKKLFLAHTKLWDLR